MVLVPDNKVMFLFEPMEIIKELLPAIKFKFLHLKFDKWRALDFLLQNHAEKNFIPFFLSFSCFL